MFTKFRGLVSLWLQRQADFQDESIKLRNFPICSLSLRIPEEWPTSVSPNNVNTGGKF